MRPERSLAVIAILALALGGSQVSTGAEIWIDRGTLHFEGTITKDDPARFRTLAATIDSPLLRPVDLDSDGGDVFAAMDIGRQIRVKSMSTSAMGRCVSACVFIYAGGVSRLTATMFGTGRTGLGIHRPYNTDTGIASLGEADKRYKQLDSAVRAYFKEMNVSDGLADDMLRIQPENVKFLTRAEAERYGLVGSDPSYADFIVSRMATMYGISKQEYFQRKQRIEAECPYLGYGSSDAQREASVICEESIMYGISQQEYSIRSKRLRQCYPSKDINAEWDCTRAVFRGERLALATPAGAEICKYVDRDGNMHYSNAAPEKGWTKVSCVSDGAPDSFDAARQWPREDLGVGRRVQGQVSTEIDAGKEIAALLRILMYLGISALIVWLVVRRLTKKKGNDN